MVRTIGRQLKRTPGGAAPLHYEHHRPEQATLYRLVQFHGRAEAPSATPVAVTGGSAMKQAWWR